MKIVAACAALWAAGSCAVADGPFPAEPCDVDDDCNEGERCETGDVAVGGHAGYCVQAEPPDVCLGDSEVVSCDAGPLGGGDGAFTLTRCALDDGDAGGEAATFCGIGERPFVVACSFNGTLKGSCAGGGCDGDEATASVDGGDPIACRDPAFIGGFTCSLCLALAPRSLALFFDDDGHGSDRACVDTESCLNEGPP